MPTVIDNIIIDGVSFAAASRYSTEEIAKLHLVVEVNTSTNQIRSVGNRIPPIYPSVIIWKPDYPTASVGKTIIAECVETEKTFDTVDSLSRLQELGKAPVILNVIVPESYFGDATELLSKHGIRYDNLLTFKYDHENNRYNIKGVTDA